MGDSHSPRNPSGRKRSSGDSDDDPNGKKMKNREAARKCREKKVKQTEDLKMQNEDLMKKNKELNEKKKELEKKLFECINEIKRHKSSGCSLPSNVAAIIDSPEFSQGFCPVGVQIIRRDNDFENNSITSTNIEKTEVYSDSESDIPVKDLQPTITGLFTGKQLPANPVGKPRTRNPSSRSSSRSPPAPPFMSPNNNMGSPSPPSSSSSYSRNMNGASKLSLQPSWNQLHLQTLNGQHSPGLSPAQTVPNIDPEFYSYPKQNGFPSIEEAVQLAQKDPGVMEEVGCNPHSIPAPHYHQQSIESPKPVESNSLASFGFTPNMKTLSSNSSSQHFQYNASVEHGTIRNSFQGVSSSLDSLRPATSSSMTVSMNHTAELLSQAINNNFDASEISEDLKKQYVQLAKNLETEESQINQVNIPNEQYVLGENNVAEQNPMIDLTQIQTSDGNNRENTYENLLRLAKGEQYVTVLCEGKEYTCQLDQLMKFINTHETPIEITYGLNNNNDNNNQAEIPFAETTTSQALVTNDTVSETNDSSYILQNQTYSPQMDLTAIGGTSMNNGNIIPVTAQFTSVEAPIQPTHLPTTVLSMIEEDSQQSRNESTTGQFNESYVGSVDYSENVRDLPSLSLTEDHSNIFDKKRKTT